MEGSQWRLQVQMNQNHALLSDVSDQGPGVLRSPLTPSKSKRPFPVQSQLSHSRAGAFGFKWSLPQSTVFCELRLHQNHLRSLFSTPMLAATQRLQLHEDPLRAKLAKKDSLSKALDEILINKPSASYTTLRLLCTQRLKISTKN